MSSSMPPHKVLLLTTNHVGNNLFCTPAIRLLKRHWPNTQLDVLAMSRRGRDVFLDSADVEKIYVTKHKSIVRKIAKCYPLVIGLHYDKVQEYVSDLPHVVSVGAPGTDQHRADELLSFMQNFLACEISAEDRQYALYPQAKHILEVEKKLAVNPQDILVGMHLGCGRTAVHGWKIWHRGRKKDNKMWPLENYVELARLLNANNPNIRFVLTGSRNEKFLGKQFAKQVSNTINLIGGTSLLGLFELMKKFQVFVTQDTGPLHIACAANIPLVALFGPTQLQRTGPYPASSQHTIIKKMTMAEITPAEVCEAVLARLSLKKSQ